MPFLAPDNMHVMDILKFADWDDFVWVSICTVTDCGIYNWTDLSVIYAISNDGRDIEIYKGKLE